MAISADGLSLYGNAALMDPAWQLGAPLAGARMPSPSTDLGHFADRDVAELPAATTTPHNPNLKYFSVWDASSACAISGKTVPQPACTALSGSMSTILTVFNWICVGIQRRGGAAVLALDWPIWC